MGTKNHPSGKELEVLKVLASGDQMYGLLIVEKSDGRLTRSSIYNYLARLEDKGMVEVKKTTDSHPGMPRPLYRITGLGQRALAAAELLGVSALEVGS